jgi:hypothetical protein
VVRSKELLKVLAQEVVLVGEMLFGAPGTAGGFIWSPLVKVLEWWDISKERKDLLRQIFALSGVTQVWPGRDHPLAPKGVGPHPDNMVATKALRPFFQSNLIELPDRAALNPSMNLICVGGTMDNPFVAQALEYQQTRDGWVRKKDPLLTLDIEEVPEKQPQVWRIVEGKRYQVPNCSFKSPWGTLTCYAPGGEPQTDWLIITRIPNILSLDNFVGGAQILIIQGGHGVGTQAFKLVAKRLSLDHLKGINSEREGGEYYQICFKIPQIDIRKGWQVPARIEYLPRRTRPIAVDTERIKRELERGESA